MEGSKDQWRQTLKPLSRQWTLHTMSSAKTAPIWSGLACSDILTGVGVDGVGRDFAGILPFHWCFRVLVYCSLRGATGWSHRRRTCTQYRATSCRSVVDTSSIPWAAALDRIQFYVVEPVRHLQGSKSPKAGKQGFGVEKLPCPLTLKKGASSQQNSMLLKGTIGKPGVFDSEHPLLGWWEMGVFWPTAFLQRHLWTSRLCDGKSPLPLPTHVLWSYEGCGGIKTIS